MQGKEGFKGRKNCASQVVGFPPLRYKYDANGNLLFEDEGCGVKKEYTNTAFDRIKTSRVYFGGVPNVSLSNKYRYDGLQRRVLQEDKSKKTLRSVYIQTSLSVLSEWEVHRDGSAITNRRIGNRQYFYAAGELYSIKEYRLPNSDIEYYYKDRQGSIKAAAQGDGRIRKRIDYTPFGGPLGTWSLSAGYTGKPYDFNMRLSNYGFRDYSPHTGRFTTVDPIRDEHNWYVYCNNDPVNWVDAWGLSAGDGKREGGEEADGRSYKEGVNTTRSPYLYYALAEGEGIGGSYTYDIYTAVQKNNDGYELKVWELAVSDPQVRHSDIRYFGNATININNIPHEEKPLLVPDEVYGKTA